MEYSIENKEFDKLLEFMGMVKYAYEAQTNSSITIRDNATDEDFKQKINYAEYVPKNIFKFRYKSVSWRVVEFKYSNLLLFQAHAVTEEGSHNHYYQVICIKDFSNRVEIEEAVEVGGDYIKRSTSKYYYRDIVQIQYNGGYELKLTYRDSRKDWQNELFWTNETIKLKEVGESARIIATYLKKLPLPLNLD